MAATATSSIDPSTAFVGAPTTRTDFTACVDACVRAMLAASPAVIAQGAIEQLRCWLGDRQTCLADGTPLDHDLFDETLLGVEERIPHSHVATPRELLRATRRLAESIYATP
ncbi:MAG: hypothetical protein JSR65_09600 [Proteobacteria bacterium]|nr:hypothetical protein [Pseudomonadota bacterium]